MEKTRIPIERRKDEEVVVHIHGGILLSRKKETATPMHQSDLSKADRERQVSHDITCMWNLKHDTNEFRNRPTVLEKRRVVGDSP